MARSDDAPRFTLARTRATARLVQRLHRRWAPVGLEGVLADLDLIGQPSAVPGDAAGDGFHPEVPALEPLPHPPAAWDRFPALFRDPALDLAHGHEGAQCGAGLVLRHATHLQRLLGNLPLGNTRNGNTERPMRIGNIQERIHAIA